MNYIIQTNSISLLNYELNKLINKYQINSNDIYRFDFEEEKTLNKILLNHYSDGILSNKKLTIIRNPSFLSEENKSSQSILNNLISIKTDNILVFYFDKLKISKKNLKIIKDEIKILKLNQPAKKELESYVKKQLEKNKVKFDSKIITKFLDKTKYDFDLVNNEILKMILSGTYVDQKYIDLNVYDLKRENIFKIVNYLITKNFDGIEKIINDLKMQSFSPVLILEIIVNELSLILQLKIANDNYETGNLKNGELGLNNFRKMNLERQGNIISPHELKTLYNNIFELLLKFKTKQQKNPFEIIKAKLFYFIAS